MSKQITLTLGSESQHRALLRQARSWAKWADRELGISVGQPVSAYVRWLIARDGKEKR